MKIISTLLYLATILTSFFIGNYYYYLFPLHKTNSAATAIVYPTQKSKVNGIVTFTQEKNGIRVAANITGLTPGKHGFHVHEYGDCSSHDGLCTGAHFNPTNAPHGSPQDKHVHIGDFGNIIADENGDGHYDKLNKHIKLFGPHSIIGRAVIIHEQPDDLQTQPTGNSGKRIGCGVIGITK